MLNIDYLVIQLFNLVPSQEINFLKVISLIENQHNTATGVYKGLLPLIFKVYLILTLLNIVDTTTNRKSDIVQHNSIHAMNVVLPLFLPQI